MYNILHGTWLPGNGENFSNEGQFFLWAETTSTSTHHLGSHELLGLITKLLPSKVISTALDTTPSAFYFALPSADVADTQPLPSIEMAHYHSLSLPSEIVWQQWQINGLVLIDHLTILKELQFQAAYHTDQLAIGSDLQFWMHFNQTFRQIIEQHHYIPALVAHKDKLGKRETTVVEGGWQIIAPNYHDILKYYADAMPMVCRGVPEAELTAEFFNYDAMRLLDHYAVQTLDDLVSNTSFTQAQLKTLGDNFITHCVNYTGDSLDQKLWFQWQSWYKRLVQSHQDHAFVVGFRLHTSPNKQSDQWPLEWFVVSHEDPSLQLLLVDYWLQSSKQKNVWHQRFGKDFQQALLIQLGQATQMYPKIRDGLNTAEPCNVTLSHEEALNFLRDSAWVLESAGYKVVVPSWWTAQGRQRAKLRINSSLSTSQAGNKSYFNANNLINYRYELAIGEQPLSEQEWQQLINAKSELVQFRGQWIEIDRNKMSEMLALWQKQEAEPQQMSMMQLMQRQAALDDDSDIIADDGLRKLLAAIYEKDQVTAIKTPKAFQGELRAYQQRGVSWLAYLQRLGMGACLADDMGLGKTVQIIALLQHERQVSKTNPSPTLLIAPTSVLGNWQKELQRFAPELTAMIHHGAQRPQQLKIFKKQYQALDMLITSFTLIRKDQNLFEKMQWQRVVVDEAQNIKNPKTAQTKAILKLPTSQRIALTGTPVENRLLDLWSIFNFLNPNYLGNASQFKKSFETPIQKNQNPAQARVLKRLVEPFILRRLKSDKAIIKDLPDKVEQNVYCNLTKEQASLYEVVVKEVEESINDTQGIQRKGLILATLTRLKQICNHPMQFLQDNSQFTTDRSHKLARLAEMTGEVIDEGESLLIFTQYTEIGEALQQYFIHNHHYTTYFLHGGLSVKKREQMIEQFQSPDNGPSVFILSLKAGGVGITLTQAKHVFHFDRWWNPAVENQATDRAYRIGQKNKVFVHKMVTLGTLEERIDQMIRDKQQLADNVVGNDESWLAKLDNDAFRELIQLNRNAILE